MFIDTHAHLDFPEYDADRDAVIARAREGGVWGLINVGIDVPSSEKSIALAQQYPFLYASVGVHPHEASRVSLSEVIPTIKALCQKEKVVALGEIGLDYYRNLSSHDDQKSLLSAFLELYTEVNLPLILHARDAFSDFFPLIKKVPTRPVKGVMHCFSGDEGALDEALSLGLYVSITGPVTYPKSDQLRKIVQRIPDERLLLETDAPYLAPQIYRGKRNEPAYVVETARSIAALREISLEDIGRITTRNCHALFGFPELHDTPCIVYKIRDTLYINTTTACTNDCTFCVRFVHDIVKGHNLRMTSDPEVDAVLKEIEMYKGDFIEVVFCGLGEPLLRLDFIKKVATALKTKGVRIRIDTNGHGNLIHQRNIVPELKGLIDTICVSLNAPNETQYHEICKPHFEGNVYQAVIDFIHEAKKVIPQVQITYVTIPEVDPAAMEKCAQSLGVRCRTRQYNTVG